MNTNWKVIVVATALLSGGLLVAFLFGMNAFFVQSKDIAHLEERVAELEKQVAQGGESPGTEEALEIWPELFATQFKLTAFRGQVVAREFGSFYAQAWSSLPEGFGVSFESVPEGPDNIVWTATGKAGEPFKVVLYSTETREVVDEYDSGALTEPGDLVVAWFAGGEAQAGLPSAPYYGWEPYYWNEDTGLAVAFVDLSGIPRQP